MDGTRQILIAVARADLYLPVAWSVLRAALAMLAAGAALRRIMKRGKNMTWDRLVKGFAALVGAVAGLFGEWNAMLTILVAVMTIDYLSGLIVAVCGRSPKTEGGRLSSRAGFVGIARKAFIMLLVLLATLLDRTIGNDTMVFQSSLTFYYIANEGLSILENAALMGVRFPEKIKRALEMMKSREDEAEDRDE